MIKTKTRIILSITLLGFAGMFLIGAETVSAADFIIDGTSVTLSGVQVYDTIRIINGGILYVEDYDGDPSKGKLELQANEIFIDATSSINADGKGYRGYDEGQCGDGEGPGGGGAGAFGVGSAGGGGGYGGAGGRGGYVIGWSPGAGGSTYGDENNAGFWMGSGGATGTASPAYGGDGGGAIILNAGNITIEGSVTANGANGSNRGGGGSGGGIEIIATNNLIISGLISANGGYAFVGHDFSGGGGGGGRITIIVDNTYSITGSITVDSGEVDDCMYPGLPGSDGTYVGLFPDTTPPKVILISPSDNYELEEGELDLIFKQIDNSMAACSCDLYLDGEVAQTNPSVPNDTPTTFSVSGINPGQHWWTVQCTDGAGNIGTYGYLIASTGDDGIIYQSTDGYEGDTWEELDLSMYVKEATKVEIHGFGVDQNGRVYANIYYRCTDDYCGDLEHFDWGYRQLFRKPDDGKGFELKNQNIWDTWIFIPSVAGVFNGDVYAAANYEIYKSTDGGATFDLIPGSPDVFEITIDSNDVIYGLNRFGGLERSIDGTTFTHLSGGVGDEYSLVVAPNNDVYVASFGGLYKSSDMGETRSKVLFDASNRFNSLEASSNGYIFVGLRSSPKTYIYRSTDNGISGSWESVLEIDGGTDNVDVFYIDSYNSKNVFAYVWVESAGELRIYKSENYGDLGTWSIIKTIPTSKFFWINDYGVQMRVVENVSRSFNVIAWPQPGGSSRHTGFSSGTAGASFITLKWTADLGLFGRYGSAVTADIDGDGIEEVVAMGEAITVFDGKAGDVIWTNDDCYPGTGAEVDCSNSDPSFTPYMSIAAKRSGVYDVVGFAQSMGNYLICRDSQDGTLRWYVEFGTPTPVLFTAADLDGDGIDEIIVASGGNLTVFDNKDGALKWQTAIGFGELQIPAVADLNQDGDLEIIVAGDDVRAFDKDGNSFFGPVEINTLDYTYNDCYITISDVSGDSKPEIINISYGIYDGVDGMYVLNGTGAILWSKDIHIRYGGSVAVADLDKDGKGEIVVPLEDGGFYVLDGDSTELWHNIDVGKIKSAPVVVDIDNDGELEIIVQTTEDNKIFAFNFDTKDLLWEWEPFPDSAAGYSSLAVSDIDGDGRVEIILIANNNILYVLGVDDSLPIVTIEARDKNNLLISDGGTVNDVDTNSMTISSSASDASGIQNHKIKYWVNGTLHAPVDEWWTGGTHSITIGSFAGGSFIEYQATATDNSFNYAETVKKSFTVISTNRLPYIEDASQTIQYQSYCGIGSGIGLVGFKWTYRDHDGDNESRFDFRVNDVNDPDPENPEDLEIDRSVEGLTNPDGTENNQSVVVISPITDDKITYNTTYYWWVKVFDDKGGDSGWKAGPSFTTTAHAWPWPGFTLDPDPSIAGEPTQLCAVRDIEQGGICESDISICYDGDSSCSGGTFFWDISDCNGIFVGGTDENSESPKVKLYSSGRITLYITDKDGFGPCSGFKDIEPKLPYPGWKEIPPR